MGLIADGFNTWLRDYVTDGVPGSGANNPSKAEGRALGALIEAYCQTIAPLVGATSGAIEIMRNVGGVTDAVAVGSALDRFRLPRAISLSAVRLSLTSASSSGPVQVDIKANGTSIFSTKVQVDQGQTTSSTSATAFSIIGYNQPDDAEITIDVTEAGSGATGLKVTLIGARTGFGTPAVPVFVAAQADTYPSGLQQYDIALVISANDALGSAPADIITPAGWTALVSNLSAGPSTTFSHYTTYSAFWKRLTGSETGSIPAAGQGNTVYVFRGCVRSGNPFESLASAISTTTAINGSSVTSTGPNRLVIAHTIVEIGNIAATPINAPWTLLDSRATDYNGVCRTDYAISSAPEYFAGADVTCTPWFGNLSCPFSLAYALVPGD